MITNPDLNYIQRLIENQIAESRTLEFKRELWGSSDSDKKEMLKDISAIANTDGGRIIVGVAEDESVITEIVGVDSTHIDATVTGLTQSIMDGIEPKINGINFFLIQHEAGKCIIVIDIPKSWASPHMVTLKNTSRFYKRVSNNVYQLGVKEIRDEFLMTDTIYEKIRKFRQERYKRITRGDTPIPLVGSSFVVLHSIPINSWMSNIDYSTIRKKVGINHVMPRMHEVSHGMYIFDGYISYSSSTVTNTNEYSQFFRNGTFELVSNRVFFDYSLHETSYPSIRAQQLIENCKKGLSSCLEYQIFLGCTPPFIINLAIINTNGLLLSIKQGHELHLTREKSLILPEIYIESLPEDLDDTQEILQNTFDQIWNAFGYEKCLL